MDAQVVQDDVDFATTSILARQHVEKVDKVVLIPRLSCLAGNLSGIEGREQVGDSVPPVF